MYGIVQRTIIISWCGYFCFLGAMQFSMGIKVVCISLVMEEALLKEMTFTVS